MSNIVLAGTELCFVTLCWRSVSILLDDGLNVTEDSEMEGKWGIKRMMGYIRVV